MAAGTKKLSKFTLDTVGTPDGRIRIAVFYDDGRPGGYLPGAARGHGTSLWPVVVAAVGKVDGVVGSDDEGLYWEEMEHAEAALRAARVASKGVKA